MEQQAISFGLMYNSNGEITMHMTLIDTLEQSSLITQQIIVQWAFIHLQQEL